MVLLQPALMHPAVLLLPSADLPLASEGLEVLLLLVMCLQRLRDLFQKGISMSFVPIKLLA